MSIYIHVIMSIDTDIDMKKTYTKVIVSIDMKVIIGYYVYRYNKCRVYRHEKKETYMKVIVSIDIIIFMSIHTILASLSTMQLAVLGGEGGGGQHGQRFVWGERDGLPA